MGTDDKVLQQILGELKTINGRLDSLETGQNELRRGQQEQDRKLTKLAMHVEHDIAGKINVLFDHRQTLDEKLDRIEQKIADHDDRLDRHWEEIMFLKAKVR